MRLPAIVLLAVLLFPSCLLAQTASESPVPGSRILKTFDFEETALNNYESTPMDWYKVQDRGYPRYSLGAFDHSVYRSGSSKTKTSFMLHTEGGSVAYQYYPPPERRIPIQSHADYYILAFVRTAKLRYARPDLVAWFTGPDGKLITSSETHCQPYHPATAAGADAWQVLYIYMPGPAESTQPGQETRGLALQLGLLQPQQLGPQENPLGPYALYQQDIEGTVWFDDITVFQIPRIAASVHRNDKLPAIAPASTFAAGQPVELDLLVSDLHPPGASATAPARSPDLLARLRITDSDNVLFASDEFRIIPTADQAWTHRYIHPPLPAGLYNASLEVFSGSSASGSLIARRQTPFLCLPQSGSSLAAAPPANDFGLGATSWNAPAAWNDLPALLRQTGAGTIQLPAWRRDMSEEALTRRDPPFDSLLAALQRQNIHTIGAFAELPAPIATHLTPANPSELGAVGGGLREVTNGTKGGKSVFDLLNADRNLWRPYLSFLLTRYSNRIDQWELGSPDVPFSGFLTEPIPSLPAANSAKSISPSAQPAGAAGSTTAIAARFYARTYPEIADLLPRPQIIIPWNALFDFDAAQYPHALLDLRIPPIIKPSQIPAYLASFHPTDAAESLVPFIHLEGLSPREAPRAQRLADFAQRIVFSRALPAAASAPIILYDVREDKPDELLLVYRTLIHALGNSSFIGELTLASDIRAFLFRKNAGATLVLWSESSGKQAGTPLDLPLGPAPRTTDLLGNPAALSIDQATQLTHLNVLPTPLVIENVDPRPLQLACSFAILAPSFPAGAGSLQTQVTLTNPYSEGLSGAIRFSPPPHWTFDPPSIPVSIAGGATQKYPVTVRYPFAEPAGPKRITAQFLIDPPQGNITGLSHLDLTFPSSVGSDQIDMEGFALFQENGDVVIQQVITNTSGEPIDAMAYALVPGFQRQERYVITLPPNQTTVKRYTFSAAEFIGTGNSSTPAQTLAGKSATLGARKNDGRILLTKTIPFE